MRVLFMGTPDFAATCLQKLIDEKYDICAVFTQSDKPKGRGHKLAAPPVKTLALENHIPVFQPLTLRDGEAKKQIEEYKPDLIIVVAYGKILPKEILEIPSLGCVNVHASLLPQYRGAAPIQWAIINGEEKTGITTMYMAEGLDTGDMLLKKEVLIHPDETAGELHDELAEVGASLLIQTIQGLEANSIVAEKQDDSLSSYASMLDKETGLIDWSQRAQNIHNLVRGLAPSPSAHTLFEGKAFKIHKAKLVEASSNQGKTGEMIDTKNFIVSCGDGTALQILEVQAQNKKRMSAKDFLRGHVIHKKVILGKEE